MTKLIENMNENQKKAILTTEGPLMIIAGAGSGKTRVITQRIAYLIYEKKVYENNILAITFTNKAAKEMKERIYNIVGETSKYIWINTFHSMCVRILREHIENLGYNKNFTILDSSEQKSIIKNILKNLNYSENDYEPKSILKIISNSKNEYKKAKDVAEAARFGFMKVVAEVYSEYEKYLKKNAVLDFDDLLIKVIELFEKYPEILAIYQNKFKYIHVDEYQDTNLIQYKLITMLAALHNNICIVGDDDQSIYSWRGACIDNIKNFEKDFKNVEVVFLDQNYRSNSIILTAANSVIKNNVDRKDKNLWSENKGGSKINLYHAFNDLDEAENISRKIKSLVKTGKEYKDIAILYRANYLSRTLENLLLTNSIPYKIIGSLKFLQRQEVKDLLSYINVLVNNNDELSLRRIINVPRRGIGQGALEKIENYMAINNTTMYNTLANIEKVGLSKKSVKDLQSLYNTFEKYSDGDNFSIDQIIMGIYVDSGYEEMLKNSKDEYSESRMENISELVTSAKEYSEINNNIMDYITEMSLASDSDDENLDNAVTLSTIHASKGLEYDTVFIVALEENIFPSVMNSDDLTDEQNKMEEERRLAYVAITRAKNNLYLSNANRRMQFGNTKFNEISRFIKEIPEDLLLEERSLQLSSLNKINSDNNNITYISKYSPKIKEKKLSKAYNFNIYDKVSHKKFGKGIVKNIIEDSIIIKFEEYGEKTLLLEYANLIKE
ncbi:UvrD-helicase domain-containing protein [Gemella sp. zg-570]|uniref:ATP-dependent helicase n=1 Tax=Gemella sp. zg-570 TaxID=2840371 RepID=UPI001C0E672B|nr:UvrD-helicase domain-containing protein [Gemella sp. zg-570]QWQ39440.1 UvrD-helicase domain-containing protein [Gemella sp. zg-570]